MNFRIVYDYFEFILLLIIVISVNDACAKKDTVTRRNAKTKIPEITIPQGTLQGITRRSRRNRTIYAFLGIPYARPPVGNLRFSNPLPAEAWEGTMNATLEGNTCSQFSYTGYIGDEDCLYLNVYTPQLPEGIDTHLLPVMLFISGEGFELGNGNSDQYGPDYFLDEDLLLVTMNYRVGPLGFLSTGDEVASGNWGLKDQVLALKWLKKNIEYFGGDPNQITLFGHSAGAAAVQLLALSDSTAGLFHRYISQSGAAFGFWVHRPRLVLANVALNLGDILGCPTDSSYFLIECLREFNASDIVETRPTLYEWNTYPLFVWGPTDEPDIDGAILIDSPTNLYNAGKIRDLPSITGVVADEGVGFAPGPLPDFDAFRDFLENFDFALPAVLQYSDQLEDVTSLTADLKDFYFDNNLTTNRTEVWANCVKLVADVFFVFPVHNAVQKLLALSKTPSFVYSFGYRGTYSSANNFPDNNVLEGKVLHGDELSYLFSRSSTRPQEMTETDLGMVETMVQLWTSFAITGVPKTTATISNITWLPYSSDGNYLRIGSGSNATLEIRYDFFPERKQFWMNFTGAAGSENAATTISPLMSMTTAFVQLLLKNIFIISVSERTLFGRM